MNESEALAFRRGRSGRPYNRMKAWLKRAGTNTCWLCGAPIDMGLPVNHAMSWTLDHALPLSLYPHLSLDRDNAREAHRRCNSSKGNSMQRTSKTSRNW